MLMADLGIQVGILLLTCHFLRLGSCLPNGAPYSACQDIVPHHPGSPRESQSSPFSLEIKRQHSASLRLILEGSSFKGFLVQGVNEDGRVIGNFKMTNYSLGGKYLNCNDLRASGFTHKSNEEKALVEVIWNPPRHFNGTVTFRYSIVQNYTHYWSPLTSEPFEILRNCQADRNIGRKFISWQEKMAEEKLGKKKEIRDLDRLNLQPHINSSHEIFNNCGLNKSCFSIPRHCDSNCILVATWKRISPEFFEFELLGKNEGYLAVGLSFDSKMGDDLTSACLFNKLSGKVEVHTGCTVGFSNRITRPPNLAVFDLTSKMEDGFLSCKFKRPNVVRLPRHESVFDLGNGKFHVFLAKGDYVKQNMVKHSIKEKSEHKVKLDEIQIVEAKSKIFIKMHGFLMILAWIGSASVGLLCARFYKKTFQMKLFKKDVWFMVHRNLMLFTWAVTLISFGLIFYEREGISDINIEEDSHAMLGCFTTAFSFVQPFAAAVRPAPTSKYREVFNKFHFYVGTAAHYMAMTAVFFSVELDKADLPIETLYLLMAFLGVHLFVQVTLSLLMYSEMQMPTKYKKTNKDLKKEEASKNMGNNVRKVFLVAYSIFNLFVTIVMMYLIAAAPTREALVNAGILPE